MKKFFVFGAVIFLLLLVYSVFKAFSLQRAHSTFENYYAFRGCQKLIEKKTDYGLCRTASGQTIKIVKFKNKWYLDGDLPWGCIGPVCLGW